MIFYRYKTVLNKKEWILLKLKIVNGFSDGEIAAMLGVSRQAVNKQINKIKKKLKTISDFKEKSY
ncbi:HTH domain-containing protein [Clostridium sp. ASF356]|nr:HTH domain-containing protein [Clostridium sp. MD294]